METNTLDTNMLIEAYQAFKALQASEETEASEPIIEAMNEASTIELMPIVGIICAIYIVFNLYFLFEKYRIKE